MKINLEGLTMQPLNAISSQPNTTYTYADDNRVLTAGSASFEYYDNGNLITKTVGSNVTNYTWDFNDMLMQLTAGGNTYEYRYDGLWGRRARIENSVEKRYVFGLAETDASGNITAYYVYGLGLISKITPSNQSYFYHFDGIASTVGISNPSGNMVNKYAYDAFGKVLSEVEGITNRFKYVGELGVMDEGNGLLYMWARYYDPEVGRFVSKDPIGFLGGLNLYTYTGNNPVNFVDPLGLFWDEAGNLSAGFGDTLSKDIMLITPFWSMLNSIIELPSPTQAVRILLGVDDVVNPCSGWYQGGEYAAYAWEVLAGGLRGGAEVSGFGPFRWLNNNPYFRLGYSRWPHTQGRIPRMAIGTSHKLNWRLTVLGY